MLGRGEIEIHYIYQSVYLQGASWVKQHLEIGTISLTWTKAALRDALPRWRAAASPAQMFWLRIWFGLGMYWLVTVIRLKCSTLAQKGKFTFHFRKNIAIADYNSHCLLETRLSTRGFYIYAPCKL